MTLEKLLNILCEKGWKPRGKEETKRLNYNTLYREVVSLEFDNYNLGTSYSIRDLVSKSSGLWQFVCENGMVDDEERYTREHQDDIRSKQLNTYYSSDYEYRLIESSLKDESELEEFLLNNIKVDEKYTEEEQELKELSE